MHPVKPIVLALGSFLLSGVSEASTIESLEIVSFDSGTGFHSQLNYDGYNVDGVWEERGFSVEWVIPEVADRAISITTVAGFNGSVSAADRSPGVDNYVTSLQFSRRDQRPFTLREFSLPYGTDSRFDARATFVPFSASGALDYSRRISETFDIIYPNMILSGTTVENQSVELRINTFLEGAVNPFNEFARFGDGVVEIDNGVLTDLRSLSVSLDVLGVSYFELLRSSLEFSDISSLFSVGFEQCSLINPIGGGCSIDNFGKFQFNYDLGGANFSNAVELDNFIFDIGAIAPVPIPAGGGLLFASLTILGLVSRNLKVSRDHSESV